ncbi:hypothetical protein DSOL_2669 [Desulfosporosinus metallidurans]|uniref:Uncharacterized protein n=1 Tax=Desulfosporosinus metallidurans TaxID=1888891 RepID=A0A1Q8QW11_9FIRM|nr:hypothetical protein DSOL_2669 [Desulfosporosinus metallidurans]
MAFIVITFGSTAATDKFNGIWMATVGASLALLIVVILGLAIRGPLTKIPENTLKFSVDIMLVTFGTFWAGEGLGIQWPYTDLFLFVLITFFLALSVILINWLKPYGIRQKKLASAGGNG